MRVIGFASTMALVCATPALAMAQAGAALGGSDGSTSSNSNLYNGGRPPTPQASTSSAPARRGASGHGGYGTSGGAYGRSTTPQRGGANVPGAAYVPQLEGMLSALPQYSSSSLPDLVSLSDDGSVAGADAERARRELQWLEHNRARLTREQAIALNLLEESLGWLRHNGVAVPLAIAHPGDGVEPPQSTPAKPPAEPTPPAPARKKGSTAGGTCCTEQWCYDNTFRCKNLCNDQSADYRSAMSCQMTCDRLESRCVSCCSQPTNAPPAGNSTGVPCSGSCWGVGF